MSGPWNESQLALPPGKGRFSGRRTSPPQTPATRHPMPISSRGARPIRFLPSAAIYGLVSPAATGAHGCLAREHRSTRGELDPVAPVWLKFGFVPQTLRSQLPEQRRWLERHQQHEGLPRAQARHRVINGCARRPALRKNRPHVQHQWLDRSCGTDFSSIGATLCPGVNPGSANWPLLMRTRQVSGPRSRYSHRNPPRCSAANW